MKDELREKIAEWFRGKYKFNHSFVHDEAHVDLADQILTLIAPELEKARKYDAIEKSASEDEWSMIVMKAGKWDMVKEIINPVKLRLLADWIDMKYPDDSDPEVQKDLRRWADGGISKTINLPNTASIDDIKTAYMEAFNLGCKGITIYRDMSKGAQVLYAKPSCDGDACYL